MSNKALYFIRLQSEEGKYENTLEELKRWLFEDVTYDYNQLNVNHLMYEEQHFELQLTNNGVVEARWVQDV